MVAPDPLLRCVQQMPGMPVADDPGGCSDSLAFVSGQSPGPWMRHCVSSVLQDLAARSWYPSLFDEAGGKMFGVLVVRTKAGVGYLSGFSGMLAGSWQQQGFVPPVFDTASVAGILQNGEAQIDALTARLARSGLQQRCDAARSALDNLEHNMEADLARLHFSLSRRKAHRRMHRDRLAQNHEALTDAQRGSRVAGLQRQSQQDRKQRKASRRQWQEKIDKARDSLAMLEQQRVTLERQRAALSRQTQASVFECYKLCNPSGVQKPIASLFEGELPPGGAGDCAAPKLLHYANQRGYTAIGLAEFWVGASPQSGVRRHGYYYPPCRAKCGPLMGWLTGRKDPMPGTLAGKLNARAHSASAIQVVHEDESIAIINKPAGLLSVPGKTLRESVLTRVADLYPLATGPLLVHRLDMDTSGLMLVAKNPVAHKALQHQFIARSISKRYLALLEGNVERDEGVISLPLRVDLDDRPRQLVCATYGKPATTRFRVLERKPDITRVAFEPVTGRTHQLRVHAAHRNGLYTPIVGDPLYGRAADRMMLHAESITFRHPDSGQSMTLSSPAPF